MDILRNIAAAYFASPDGRLLTHLFALAVTGSLAVLLDRGRRRLNRAQFVATGFVIQSVWTVAAMAIHAGVPVGFYPVNTNQQNAATQAAAPNSTPTPIPPPPPSPPPGYKTEFDPTTAVAVSPPVSNNSGDPVPDENSPANTPSASADVIWLRMIAELVLWSAAGFAWGLAAMARFRDGYVERGKLFALIVTIGALVISPIAFGALLYRGSRNKSSVSPKPVPLNLNSEPAGQASIGKNTRDDPIVLSHSLSQGPFGYVTAEYEFTRLDSSIAVASRVSRAAPSLGPPSSFVALISSCRRSLSERAVRR
jgi:hypothetical protein